MRERERERERESEREREREREREKERVRAGEQLDNQASVCGEPNEPIIDKDAVTARQIL
jgi:hypothetical protein